MFQVLRDRLPLGDGQGRAQHESPPHFGVGPGGRLRQSPGEADRLADPPWQVKEECLPTITVRIPVHILVVSSEQWDNRR